MAILLFLLGSIILLLPIFIKKFWVKTDYTDKSEFHYVQEGKWHKITLTYRVEGNGQFVFKKVTDWHTGLIEATLDNTCRDMLVEYNLPLKEWFMNSLRERANGRLLYAYQCKHLPIKVRFSEIEMGIEELDK